MEKIYLISSKKKSRLISDMKKELDHQNIFYEHIDPEYLIFDATGGEGKISFWYKGRALDFNNSYVFISNRNRNNLLISLLVMILNHMKIPHSAPLYENVQETEDKHHQLIKLFLHKLPVPKTIVCSASAFLRDKEFFKKKFTEEFVLKAAGSRGDYVWKLSSCDQVEEYFEKLNPQQRKILSFQYLVEEASFDVRALFFQDKCISAMKRQGEGFLNNHSKGASVEKYLLSEKEQSICEQASLVSGLDFLGIDFMVSEKGPVILELQNSPFMRGMRSTDPSLNIGASIVKVLLNKNHEG